MTLPRLLYRLLGLLWQGKALARGGPLEWGKQRVRSAAHRELAKALRRSPLRSSQMKRRL